MHIHSGEKSPVVGPRPAECDEGVWDTAQTLLPKLCRKGGVPGFGICIDTLCDIAGCASHSAYNETTFPELVFGQAYLVGTSAQNLQHCQPPTHAPPALPTPGEERERSSCLLPTKPTPASPTCSTSFRSV